MFNFALTASRLEDAVSKYIKILLEEEKEYNDEEVKFNYILQNDAWLRILDIAKEVNRQDAISFIENKLGKNVEYAPTPEYIKTVCKKTIEIDYNNIHGKAKKITHDLLHKKQYLDDEVMTHVDDIISKFTDFDCINIIGFSARDNKVGNLIDDPDMLEGPLNSIVYIENNSDDEEKHELHECLGAPLNRKSKGCRMLTCICINEDDDEQDIPVTRLQWFRGKCDLCNKKIKKECYAFRLPLDAGGWIGCYCSSDCAMSYANKRIKHGLKGENDFEHFSRFNSIEASVLHKGILDRDDLYENETNNTFYTNKNNE